MTHARTLIESLGGYRTLAEELTAELDKIPGNTTVVTHTRVHNWFRRGLAREFRTEILAIAKRRKVEITMAQLREASGPQTDREPKTTRGTPHAGARHADHTGT